MKPRDFVINRYKWGHLKRELGRLAPRAYNSPVPFERFVDKYEQLVSIRSEAFTIPRWVLGTPGQGFERMASLLGVPFVAKGLASSQGAEVELVSSEADMGLLASRFGADRELVFEEFVSSSAGRDLRLFAVRGLPLACMERRSECDFRANVALGAEVSARRVDDALECVARDVYEQTGLDFVGVEPALWRGWVRVLRDQRHAGDFRVGGGHRGQCRRGHDRRDRGRSEIDRQEAEDFVYESYLAADGMLRYEDPDSAKRHPEYSAPLLERLSGAPCAVVTGSKGKGSVVRMTACALGCAPLRRAP